MTTGELEEFQSFITSEAQKAYSERDDAHRKHNPDELWARGHLDGLRTVVKVIDVGTDARLRDAHRQ